MAKFRISALHTQRFWEPIARALLFMAWGAYALAFYLDTQEKSPSIDQLKDDLSLTCLVFLVFWSAVQPLQKADVIKEPSPAPIGAGVVLACGLSAAYFMSRNADWPSGYLVPAAVVLLTLGLAFLVYRFASKHRNEIGEARFQTVPREGAP